MKRGVIWSLAASLCFAAGCVYSNGHAENSVAKGEIVVSAVPPPLPPDSQLKPQYLKAMQLSEPMKAALKKYDADFAVWALTDYPQKRIEHYPYAANSLPYAVKGDFNGDGIDDMALTGHDKNANLVIVLLSTATVGYYVTEIEHYDCYDMARKHGKNPPYTPTVLLVFKPKGMKFFFSDMAAKAEPLKYDGIKIKAVNWFRTDKKSPSYMSFTGIKDTAPDVRIWNSQTKEFSFAMGHCETGAAGDADSDYCF